MKEKILSEKGKFLTIKKEYGPQEIKEKGSRFISFLYPVKTKEQAETIIQNIRKKFYDATHVCFSYRIGEGEEQYFRYNDDGEPSGTAGIPIYNEIKSKGYLNVMAAVVRYYGGTKLGTGGLSRAYGQSARKVIEASEAVGEYVKREISFFFPYSLTGEIMRVINKHSLDIIFRENTAQGINIKLTIPEAVLETVVQDFTNTSSGRIKISDSL